MAGETTDTTGVAPATGDAAAPHTGDAALEGTHTEVQADGGHGGAEHKVFPPFDPTHFASQLVWLAITFGVLYWLIARVAIPRIRAILENRSGRIAGDLAEAERLRSQSEAASASYEKALADARGNANRIAEGAREESKAAAARDRKAIEDDLAKRLSAAEARIADIKKQALTQVGVIAGEATEALVGQLADIDVSQQEIAGAVSSALAK
jgi:F-type H+-transporting ATPase subunit b